MLSRRSGPSRAASPGRVIAGGFAGAITVGTALLSSPLARAGDGRATFVEALFTATSAVCVTGLTVVDTGTHWSPFGQAVILLLIQAGGLGIMTLASLVAVLFSRRLGFRARLVAQAETKALTGADVRRLLRRIVVFSLVCESAAAVALTTRFAVAYDAPFGSALYEGVFHAVSAFNNAGFSTHPDSLVRYVGDPWVCLTVATAVVVGGLGFPVVFELLRSWRRPATWSVLTRVTVWVSAVMLVGGTLVITVQEASNPATLGALDTPGTLLAGFFASAMTRSGGFTTLDISAMRPETLLVSDVLMFIGGGSAGTAGGIKVTTFGLLLYVIWAEARGMPHVEVGRRRVPPGNQRQALSIALLSVAGAVLATVLLLALTPFPFEQVMFEAVSATATVGLSTGITADLGAPAQLLVVLFMYVGRIGPLTLASALALRERAVLRELPEERMIVG